MKFRFSKRLRHLLIAVLYISLLTDCKVKNPDASALSSPTPGTEDATQQREPIPAEDDSFVVIKTRSGETYKIDVELAVTRSERAVGLMHRKELSTNSGMIFVMERLANHDFWMKNTLIPLDMLFIAENGTIVGIIESAAPGTTTLRGVGRPSRFILELNGGFTMKYEIQPGDTVEVEKFMKWIPRASQ